MKVKEIQIGNLSYEVIYEKNLTLKYTGTDDINKDDDGAKAYGLISYESQTIKVDSGITPERERITLVHEVLHGLDEHYPYLDFDEMKTDTLASILVEFVDNNPFFILYLLFSSSKLKDKIKKMLSFFLPKI